ncbi:MAG: hypothetical protein M1368_05010, partial [Thaumarchaeota archaeon]|nr:hypothetical protein [Nitrososphaerota archaeon]
ETFYFPISGTYSPIIRFVAIGPNNRTTLLVTAYRPQLGDISLQVQPASFAQEATIGNATVILSVAILVFGIVESAEGISKIVRFFILKEKLGKLRQSN